MLRIEIGEGRTCCGRGGGFVVVGLPESSPHPPQRESPSSAPLPLGSVSSSLHSDPTSARQTPLKRPDSRPPPMPIWRHPSLGTWLLPRHAQLARARRAGEEQGEEPQRPTFPRPHAVWRHQKMGCAGVGAVWSERLAGGWLLGVRDLVAEQGPRPLGRSEEARSKIPRRALVRGGGDGPASGPDLQHRFLSFFDFFCPFSRFSSGPSPASSQEESRW